MHEFRLLSQAEMEQRQREARQEQVNRSALKNFKREALWLLRNRQSRRNR